MKCMYVYQMKALNELFSTGKSAVIHECTHFYYNNWHQYTKSDQTMVRYLFWLSCKVGDMSLFWFSALDLWIILLKPLIYIIMTKKRAFVIARPRALRPAPRTRSGHALIKALTISHSATFSLCFSSQRL